MKKLFLKIKKKQKNLMEFQQNKIYLIMKNKIKETILNYQHCPIIEFEL